MAPLNPVDKLTKANIEFIFDYIESLCGIALDETRSYLIDARLAPLVQQFQVKTPMELIEKAMGPQGGAIRRAVIEAITTRETYFFRDNGPFEALQFKVLPELIDDKRKLKSNRLRIWSAAASTGQEACSIAMILLEMLPEARQWDIEILGTDISEVALAKARSGVYSQLEIDRGLPQSLVSRHFAPHPEGYQVSDAVLRLIRYQSLNLLDTFPFSQPFDIIFCRNVAIYFDKHVKIDLFRRMMSWMPIHGYLFVGASESLLDCGPEFQPRAHCRGTFYQPNLVRASESARQ